MYMFLLAFLHMYIYVLGPRSLGPPLWYGTLGQVASKLQNQGKPMKSHEK